MITDKNKIEEAINKAVICRLGMSDGSIPYIVPLNFGYADGRLYFHFGKPGRKLAMVKANSNVCFEIDIDTELVKTGTACGWGMKYRCVMGSGKAVIIGDYEKKVKALDLLMKHYSDKQKFAYKQEMIDKTTMVEVTIETMTLKEKGY